LLYPAPKVLFAFGLLFSGGDETIDFMERALELARQALGSSSPNPAVGAVVVKEGKIIGEGYTQPAGFDHAEIVALKRAGPAARGAILYVSLEPCCHFGRTPPCTKAIIEAGIREVHAAVIDPNPLVSGLGLEELKSVGITVHLGEKEEEARRLNEAFFKYITTGMPFTIAKYAMTLDGKTATVTRDSRWVSGEAARRRVHQLRSICDAIMVGIETVLADDPLLTVRLDGPASKRHRHPVRVVVDSRGRIPLESKLLNPSLPGQVLVATTPQIPDQKKAALEARKAVVVILPERKGRVDLAALMRYLGEREMCTILLEGGGTLLASALQQGLVDKLIVFVTPKIVGGASAPTGVGGVGLQRMSQAIAAPFAEIEKVGEDLMVTAYPRYESASRRPASSVSLAAKEL